MERWWDSHEEATRVLALVDDRDVRQGVGTAVLGYHALAKAALEPLSKRTLVDMGAVTDVLGALDTDLVGAALGAAMAPVMGDAAVAYGQMLAGQIHADAVSGVQQAMTMWSTAGVPMPLAVERAAEVVGVPASRIGKYAQVMKAMAVQPLVRCDHADRALMDFAAHLGALEDTGMVSKDAAFEEFHPRNEDGEFQNKKAKRDVRRGRMAAFQRQAGANEAAREAQQARRERETAEQAPERGQERRLSGRQRIFQEPERASLSAVRSRMFAAPVRLTPEAPKPVMAPAPNRAVQQTSKPKTSKPRARNPKAATVHPFNEMARVNVPVELGQVAFVTQTVAQMILDKKGFTAGDLEREAGGLIFHEMSSDQLGVAAVQAAATIGLDQMVAIRISGTISLRDGIMDYSNKWSDVQLNEAVKYDLKATTDMSVSDFTPSGRRMPPGLAAPTIPMIDVRIKSSSLVQKSDYETWEDGQRHEVARNEQGEFSDLNRRKAERTVRAARMQQFRQTGEANRAARARRNPPAAQVQEPPTRMRARLAPTRTGALRMTPVRSSPARAKAPTAAPKATAKPPTPLFTPVQAFNKVQGFMLDMAGLGDLLASAGYGHVQDIGDLHGRGAVITGYDNDAVRSLMHQNRSLPTGRNMRAEDALRHYLRSTASADVVEEGYSYEDALSLADHHQGAADSDPLGWKNQYYAEPGRNGLWDVKHVAYGQMPPILVLGDAKAMHALHSGNRVRLVSYNPQESLREVIDHYDLPEGYFDDPSSGITAASAEFYAVRVEAI